MDDHILEVNHHGARIADNYLYIPVKGKLRLYLVKRWASHRKVKYILDKEQTSG